MSENLSYIVDSLEKNKKTAPNGAEYWLGRTVSKILTYEDWTNFRNVLEKAVQACDNAGAFSSNHFREFTDMVIVGSGAKRGIENWYLSRYACYLIAMNGDSSKPEIATAQSYFAAQTLRQESQDALTEQERRLLLRDRVKDANRKLSGAAKEAGVRSRMFGIFQDAGYKGLYDGLGTKSIKRVKGIGPKDDLLDCIGRTELAAHEFRATQAEEKLRLDNVVGESNAIRTHELVGRKVRKAIQDIGGTMPEKLPAEPSIKRLVDKRAREKKKALKARSKGNED